MVQRKWNALIIGCGNMGCLNDAPGSGNEYKTISFAKALKEREDLFETWLFDIDEEKMTKASDIWEMSWNFNNTCFDVIILTTPDDTHYKWLQRIVNSWYYNMPIKLIICEKPLCSNVKEAKEIVELYEKAGIPILIDYTRNFIPCLRDLTKEHGNPIYGYCLFNRGILHTAVHAVGFFEMLGLKDYKLQEIKNLDYRVWSLNVWFEDGYQFKEERTKDMDVPEYYNFHTQYVIDNAIKFLEGREELRCTATDGLKTLEIMERLCI